MSDVRRAHRPLSAVLQDVAWLDAVPPDVRACVESDVSEAWYGAGCVVAHRGEPANSWIGVAEGLVKTSSVSRSGKSVFFAAIPQGCWVGEGSVIKQELRRYDVIAMRNSRILHLPGSTFRWLQKSCLEFNRMLVERLNARLSQAICVVETDRMGDPLARIARGIAALFDPVLYPRQEAWLHLSQAELSELVGMSRSSISVGLRHLQSEGLLSTHYGRIVVHKLNDLRQYEGAEGHRSLRRAAWRDVVPRTSDAV